MNGPIGTPISSESPEPLRSGATVNVTKLAPLSLGTTVEFELLDTTEHQRAWRDVAHALGELQMWLLGPATPTASRSTQS